MVATTAPVCLAPRSTPPDGKMEAGSNVSAALRIAWPPGVAGVCVLIPMPQAWQVAVVRGFTTVHTLHCHAPPIRCRDAVVAMEPVPAPAPAPGAMRTLALVPAASGASCSSSLDPSSMTVVMPSAWSKSSMRSPLCCKGTELGVASNCGSARASMYLRRPNDSATGELCYAALHRSPRRHANVPTPANQKLTVFVSFHFDDMTGEWNHLIGQGKDQYWTVRKYSTTNYLTTHVENSNFDDLLSL